MYPPGGPPQDPNNPNNPNDPNPYAPPSGAYGSPPMGAMGGAGAAQHFPPEMRTIVAQMTKWMRFVAITTIVFLALGILGCVLILVSADTVPDTQKSLLLAVAVGGIVVCLLGIPAFVWLIQAAGHFKEGTMGGDSARLIQGFGKLKAYFIVVVIYAGLQLIGQLLTLSGAGFGS